MSCTHLSQHKQQTTHSVTRYAASVQFDGSTFYGWQALKSGLPTIQSSLEKSLSKIANHPISVIGAGRTDRGVHGVNHIIHFDSCAIRRERSWVLGANSSLPPSIAITWIKPIAPDFHARFCARWRRYRYFIFNQPTRPAHLPQGITWYYHSLCAKRMQAGADYLLGEHDFTSYRTVHCQAKKAIRRIMHIHVQSSGPLIMIDVQANGFLHHMVRNIVGVLLEIGTGKRPPIWANDVLQAHDRTQAAATAPPHGLYFVGVGYDSCYVLPKTPIGPWFAQAFTEEAYLLNKRGNNEVKK